MAKTRRKFVTIYTPISLTVKQKKKGSSETEPIDSTVFAKWKGDRRIYTAEILKVLEHLKVSQLTKNDDKVSKIELFHKELLKIGGLYKIKIGIYEEKSSSTTPAEPASDSPESPATEQENRSLPPGGGDRPPSGRPPRREEPGSSDQGGEDLDDKVILYTYVIANNLSSPREVCDKLRGKSVEIANTTGAIIFAKKL